MAGNKAATGEAVGKAARNQAVAGEAGVPFLTISATNNVLVTNIPIFLK